ncbi:hypothetical protein Pla108_19960 [Botrimarina colliarenosi]|uniref:Glucose/Sorbosone dehydrogenase domain-containing protein n=1 Tax=Botrimarina colliarenosi TaxID=2528001 RepID=A0A5C6AHY3_9BACT|nr:PQQ-dependent sugar dehydrogenase [Botrimarina colliarenosi]TWT97843.1 hypothetical protein Pla108_19960 [Botrimarina colliarenosi]
MTAFQAIRSALGLAAMLGAGVVHADYTVERVVTGLNQPTFMTQAPGDYNHLFIVERTDNGNTLGRISSYDQLTKTRSTFLDLSGTVVSDGGLLSMTFHPDYQTNGLFYTVSNVNGTNGLDEWQVTGGTPQLQRRLYEYQNLQNVFHTLNQAQFRPGGDNDELFVTGGDGGTQANSGAFNPSLIEDPNSPFGKLLKFDLTGDFSTPAGGASHPDVDLVAMGLRNPYRTSFDRQTGDFYIGDVGFNAVEEVDFIPGSHFDNPSASVLNFGWTDREGTIATIANNAGGPGSPGDINPVFEYAHNSGIELDHASALNGGSITGGYVYRGPVTELQGRYFFADFTSQVIYSGVFDTSTSVGDYDGDNFTDLQRHDIDFENLVEGGAALQNITSFGEDNAGNLYIVKFGNSFFPAGGEGEIFRISVTPEDALELIVDRDTGAITLLNSSASATAIQSVAISSAFGSLSPSEITPIAGTYDFNGDQSVDDNDAWTLSSSTSFLLSESTSGDAGQLAAVSELAYSSAGGWLRSPVEDLTATVVLGDGTLVDAQISYVGNGGVAFENGDLDFDGDIDRADFVLLAGHLHSDLSGMSGAQAYAGGDLNGDGVSDYFDFQAFKATYVALHGVEAFAMLIGVPEPGSGLLLAIGGAVALTTKGRLRRSL